jgi:hypothetical protein
VAQVHAARGDRDRAFEWLERAYANKDGALRFLKYSWTLRPVKDDARYAALLRKMNLPLGG